MSFPPPSPPSRDNPPFRASRSLASSFFTSGAPLDELGDLVRAWRARVGGSRDRAAAAATLVVLFTAMLVARRGTLSFRVLALLALAFPLAVAAGAWLHDRAVWNDPSRVIDRLAGRLDPERAGRAIRALGLIRRSAHAGTSERLAEVHVARSLRALPRDRILERAVQLAVRYGWVTVAFGALAVTLAGARGFAIFEGADVLLARHGQGLVAIQWLDPLDIDARPPEYLHAHDMQADAYEALALPRGTMLTFRGVPLHPGRWLLLSDGSNEVPFVDDGSGHVVARWPLTGTVTLKVVARFGDVSLAEHEVTPVMSIEDELPIVKLEGAPQQLRLADVGVGATIPIKYEATDDHGLREVHLVLRSGAREERRVLARLDGETGATRGGQVVRASDPFIKKSHAAIEIRVEAQDNDAVTGPKWGVSEAITIIPPEAGEPEAQRLNVLRALRDAFVDSLAGAMERTFAAPPAERAQLAEKDRESVAGDDRLLDGVAKGTPAGLPVKANIVALLRGQMRRVKEALNAELRSPGTASHGRLVAATEHLVLATDAVVRKLGQKDSRSVARSLADVADDLSLGASQMRRAQDRARGQLRADASVVVLEGGARSLVQLGSLGRDLGEIVQMDLGRVARARGQDDNVHAEMAASDLAARLRDPDPSFGAQGSSGGRAGGESGGGRGTSEDGEPSDEADQAFNEAAHEVERLSADHADEMSRVEQMMNEDDPKSRAPSEEAKSHAKNVRDATKALPSVGAGSDSWTNKGASAREHAEAMARALEEGDNAEAVASGRSALDALDEARHVAQRERWTGLFSPADPDHDRSATDQRLEATRARLGPEVAWAEERLKAARKQAALGKLSEVSEHGDQEDRLADRAGSLHDRGEGDGRALEALHQAERAAHEAASALKRGDTDEGLARQREAQRQLESAKEAMGTDRGDEAGDGQPGAEGSPGGHTDIPNAASHKGPDEFRRRVVEGLAEGAGGRQKDAIRRYADGLLR